VVDNALGQLIDGLREKNILDCVNLIITSDHGEVVMVMMCVVAMALRRDAIFLRKHNYLLGRCE